MSLCSFLQTDNFRQPQAAIRQMEPAFGGLAHGAIFVKRRTVESACESVPLAKFHSAAVPSSTEWLP